MKRYLLVLLVVFVLAIPAQAQEKIYLPLILKEDSCMGIAKLAISDGTTEISLLDLTGIHLAEDNGWTPKIIQAKGGGVFQDSSMAASRRLVYRQFGTAREDFNFNIMGISQDELIAETSDLLQMLEKAVNYWATDWQSDIVYLIAQSDCETYARYAPILYYEAQELQNPYGQPFVQAGEGAIFDDIGIMIERGHWQNVAPGDSECTETNGVQEWAYDSKWSVATSTPTDDVYALLQTTTGRILAGENGGQLLYSDDDGVTWNVSTLALATNIQALLQTTTGRIIAGDDGQMWYSDDDGATWNVLTTDPDDIVASLIQTTTGRIIAGELTKIWYSDDNGNNWTLAKTVKTYVTSLLQTTSGRILAGDAGQIWYSDDNGDTWEIITARPIGAVGSLLQTTAGRVLAGELDRIWYSDDDGDTWAIAISPTITFIYSLLQLTNGRILAGDAFQTLYSDNDGDTWNLYTLVPSSSVYSLLQIANGNIIAGDRGQIWLLALNLIDMGASSTCNNIVYVANKQNTSNLTHIFIDDGGVFGSNLLPMTVFPIDLLPAVPVVNDAIYFGTDTTIYDTGPFSSVVFDIDNRIVYSSSYTITWEYWDGAAWSALTVRDGTNPGTGVFRLGGVNSVHWIPPSDWATTTVNTIAGYWIRARLSALVGTITVPSQQSRNIYSVVLGRAEIEDTDITGDISSLSQIKLINRSDEDGPSGNAPNLYDNRILVGLRSYDRGTEFQSYINISDSQSIFGIDVSADTNTTFGNDLSAPTARSATYNPGGVEAMATRATVTLSTTIARDFYGSYHAFLRVQRTAGASTDFNVQLVFVTGSGGIQKTTESKQVQTTTAFELLDFGQVTIPVGGSLASSDLGDQIQILIQASAASGTPNLVLYDLILIPVDEWAIDSVDQTNSSTSDIGRSGDISKLLDIDSVTDPKNPIKSIVRQVGSDFVTANYNPITNGPAILQSNVDQRLWFLAAQTSATGSSYSWIAPPEIVHSVQLYKAQRYLGLRGNR